MPAHLHGHRRLALLSVTLLAATLTLTSLPAPPAAAATGDIDTLVGTGAAGDAGDCPTTSRLNLPTSVATDGAGNIYIADSHSHRIRKRGAHGEMTTIAGTGVAGFTVPGGPAVNHQLDEPQSVAIHPDGSVYIADTHNDRILKILPFGVMVKIGGTNVTGYAGDGGPAEFAQIDAPRGMTFDSAGNLYFVDSGNVRVRKIDTAGIITTIGGNGAEAFAGDGGPATEASFDVPRDTAVDSTGNVYVSDENNHRIRRIDPSGTISTVVGTGVDGYSGDGGPATAAALSSPDGITVTPSDDLVIADADTHHLRRVVPGGTIDTIAGDGTNASAGDGGLAVDAAVGSPGALGVDSNGRVVLAEVQSHKVRRFEVGGTIETVAGDGTAGYDGDCPPPEDAQVSAPAGVAGDEAGNVYIADLGNDRVRMRTPEGLMITVAGTGTPGDSGDGGPATAAQLENPIGLALDDEGNLFIADSANDRVRKVSPGGVISTVAGTGVAGFSGDGGPATSAMLRFPTTVAVDDEGNLFIADGGNDRVRKVSPGGVISTVAGTGVAGFSGDGGPATNAKLSDPYGVAVDRFGRLFVADYANHRVRRVADGVITTVAGTGAGLNGSDGVLAVRTQVNFPYGLAVDDTGNLFIADSANNRVRVVRPSGVMNVVAGTATSGYDGDGGPATAARLSEPYGVAVDAAGNVLVADTGNNRVRMVEDVAPPPTGLLRVTTNPALPIEISIDGELADNWGLNWIELPVGDHEVCFGPLPGYVPAPCQVVAVTEDQTAEVVGEYTARGYLRVVTEPALPSTISVDGVDRNDWGVWVDAAVDSYEVCFGAVEDWAPPPCEVVDVTAGTTTTVTGEFTPDSSAPGPAGNPGFLRVTTAPALGARIRVDGQVRDSWGLNWLKVAAGNHTVCFGPFPAHDSPPCQVVAVTAGQTTVVEGVYEPLGFLRVLTDPAVPSMIWIDGAPANAWGVWRAVPTDPSYGAYRVCVADAVGLAGPGCRNVTAPDPGETATVTATFTPP